MSAVLNKRFWANILSFLDNIDLIKLLTVCKLFSKIITIIIFGLFKFKPYDHLELSNNYFDDISKETKLIFKLDQSLINNKENSIDVELSAFVQIKAQNYFLYQSQIVSNFYDNDLNFYKSFPITAEIGFNYYYDYNHDNLTIKNIFDDSKSTNFQLNQNQRFKCIDPNSDIIFLQDGRKISFYHANGQHIDSVHLNNDLNFGNMTKFHDYVINYDYEGYLTIFDLRQEKPSFYIKAIDVSDYDSESINIGKLNFDDPLIMFEYYGLVNSCGHSYLDVLDIRQTKTIKPIYYSKHCNCFDSFKSNITMIQKNLIISEAEYDEFYESNISVYNVFSQQKQYNFKLEDIYINSFDIKNDTMVLLTQNRIDQIFELLNTKISSFNYLTN